MRSVCITIIILILLAGCTNGDKKAGELLETARFEEKQNNYDHAKQLYAEILKNHPASPAAKEAATRITELDRRKP